MSIKNIAQTKSSSLDRDAACEAALHDCKPLALVVDDDDDNLVLMKYVLEIFGISCIATHSGYEAVQLSKQNLFSLIFLDVVMPGMDGFGVLKQISQDIRYRKTPIVAVTALAFKRDLVRLLAAGFTSCLVKPYMLDDVGDLIHNSLILDSLAS